MQHNYFIAWPRIMKIGQIDVLFAVTRPKMKRRVTCKDNFKDIVRNPVSAIHFSTYEELEK